MSEPKDFIVKDAYAEQKERAYWNMQTEEIERQQTFLTKEELQQFKPPFFAYLAGLKKIDAPMNSKKWEAEHKKLLATFGFTSVSQWFGCL